MRQELYLEEEVERERQRQLAELEKKQRQRDELQREQEEMKIQRQRRLQAEREQEEVYRQQVGTRVITAGLSRTYAFSRTFQGLYKPCTAGFV